MEVERSLVDPDGVMAREVSDKKLDLWELWSRYNEEESGELEDIIEEIA